MPVTLENLSLLAQAYESTPAKLLFLPSEAEAEEKFRRAHEILTSIDPDKAERWLAMGEDILGAQIPPQKK